MRLHEWEKAFAGISSGTLLFMLIFDLNLIMNKIIPYDITRFGGIRQMDEPIMMLFFSYPFIFADAAVWAFESGHTSSPGTGTKKGILLGIFLLALVAVPSNFAMFTSMNWPVSVYIENPIWAVAGFLPIGILFARIWKG